MTIHNQICDISIQTPKKLGFLRLASAAFSIWRQRRALARLDPSALKDIGVTQREALLEADKPIWDVPQHWLR